MSKREGPNGNARVQEKLRNREKLLELQRRLDLSWVMGSAQGRRFMHELLFERCGLMEIYTPTDSGIYRHEGKREIGLRLATDLQANNAAEWVLMITERQQDLENERKIREAALKDNEEGEAKDE